LVPLYRKSFLRAISIILTLSKVTVFGRILDFGPYFFESRLDFGPYFFESRLDFDLYFFENRLDFGLYL